MPSGGWSPPGTKSGGTTSKWKPPGAPSSATKGWAPPGAAPSTSRAKGGWTAPGTGGGGGTGQTTAFNADLVNRHLRNALAKGDTDRTERIAKRLNVSKQTQKALLAIAESHKPKGFFERAVKDVKETVVGTAKGLPQFAGQIGKELVGFGKTAPYDITLKQWDPFGGEALRAKGPEAESPATTGLVKSFERTGQRLTHPQQAAREYSQRPFSTAIEDIGNVAIVAGGAAGAARGAGLTKFATQAERVAAAGNEIANLPFLPVSRGARALNTLYSGGKLPRVVGGGTYAGITASEHLQPIMDVLRVSPRMRSARQVLRAGEETHAVSRNVGARVAIGVEKGILKTNAEQEAARIIGQHEAESLLVARQTVPPVEFESMIHRPQNPADPKSAPLTAYYMPESIHLALDALEGKNPTLMANIDEALGTTHAFREARQAGRLAQGMDPAQVGFAPMQGKITRSLAKMQGLVDQSVKVAIKAREAAEKNMAQTARIRLEAEHVGVPAIGRPASGELGPSTFIKPDVTLSKQLGKLTERQRALDLAATRARRNLVRRTEKLRSRAETAYGAVENLPARLRPAVATGRLVEQTLVEHRNALSGAGLHGAAAGVDRALQDIWTTADQLQAQGIDPDHFIHPSAARVKAGGGGGGARLTWPRQTRLKQRVSRGLEYGMTERAQMRAEVQAAHEIIQNESVKQLAQLPYVTKSSEHMVQDGITYRYPTQNELHQQGLAGWVPTGIFDEATVIGPNTLVMPKPVLDAYKRYYQPKTWEKFLEPTYDRATRVFKTAVLPLSVSWNVGNAVTNAFMAIFLGGVDPITLAKQIGVGIREYRRTGEWPGPQRLYQAGSTHESLDYLSRENLTSGGRVSRALKAPVRAGYTVNQTVDNIFRSAVYLAKKGEGYTDAGALRLALNAMGDFTKMTPIERSVVRRAIPFYAWLRHMSQAAIRLPIEHPYRTAWMLSMSNVFKAQDAWEELLPSFMRGNIPLGGDRTLNVANFMPFSSPFAITQLRQNLNPIIKFAGTNLPHSPWQGINPLTGRAYTRPPGTGRLDEFGHEQPTAPSILEQLRVIPPQVRLLDVLGGRKDVARYESGDKVLVRNPKTGKREPIPVDQSTIRAISRYAGVPIGSKKQLQQIVDSIIARRVEAYKAAHPRAKLPTGSKSKGWSPPGTTGGSSSTSGWKPPGG
jgi:hypothetical protein